MAPEELESNQNEAAFFGAQEAPIWAAPILNQEGGAR
jgi:hypothetical protein